MDKRFNCFTNEKSSLTKEQTQKSESHRIKIIENKIDHFSHKNGQIENVFLKITGQKQSKPCMQDQNLNNIVKYQNN